MKRFRLKVNIKKMFLDFGNIILIICIVIGFINIVPKFLKKENVIKKTIPVAESKSPLSSHSNDTKGSIDVLSIGYSTLYSGLNPMQLFHEKGITSFNAASPKQNMCVSYHMLKEILTVQKPKLIIMETGNFFESRGSTDIDDVMKATYGNTWPVFRNTKRWSEMTQLTNTTSKKQLSRMALYGYLFSKDVVSNQKGYSYMKKTDKEEQLSPITKTYLPKILDLAKENKCQVLFLSFPAATSWNYAKSVTAQKTAEKYNIPFIDFNIETLNDFNWDTDTRDKGNHLNYNGSRKLTKFIGNYLKSKYNLKDHRNSSAFAQWDRDYKKFLKIIGE